MILSNLFLSEDSFIGHTYHTQRLVRINYRSSFFRAQTIRWTAWPVNFNLSLESFESQIKGLRHLIDLSLSSPLPFPARVLFTASIGMFISELPTLYPESQPDLIQIKRYHFTARTDQGGPHRCQCGGQQWLWGVQMGRRDDPS